MKIPYTKPVGFRKGKNGWQLTADWFQVNIDQKLFKNRLKQRYAYLSVRQSLEKQGFILSEESMDNSDQIHLVLRRIVN